VKNTRQLVEVARTRPTTDLVRLEALLEEARIHQERARLSAASAWKQLAAEVGVPDLPLPESLTDAGDRPPEWDQDKVLHRVLTANTDLEQAALEAERARLEIDRA